MRIVSLPFAKKNDKKPRGKEHELVNLKVLQAAFEGSREGGLGPASVSSF